MYIGGGKVLIKNTRFELNNTSGAGSFYNAGSAWIFANSEFKNNTGGGIYNAGILKLANVTVSNNGAGIINGGDLSGTNLAIRNSSIGLSNTYKMAVTNSTISSNSTGVDAAGGVTVLSNTFLYNNNTGLSFVLGHGGPDDNSERLKGCVLFNVTIAGGRTGVNASYSSSYSNNYGAASLLLNSVRITGASGAGLALSHAIYNYDTNPPKNKRGLYVTLNNVTISGNQGGGITSSARNIAAANQPDRFDVLDLRVRNSIILGNGTKDTPQTDRFVIGSFGFGSGQVNQSGDSFYLNPGKAALLTTGEVFRVAKLETNKSDGEGALRAPVYTVSGVGADGRITYDATPVYSPSYPAGKTEGFASGDFIVKTYFTVRGFETDVTDVVQNISPGENTWYLDPVHGLRVNGVFKTGNAASATGTSLNTVQSITSIPEYFPADADYLGRGSWADGDGIAADYPSAQIGAWVYNELTGTRWDCGNNTGTGADWNNTTTPITPVPKDKVIFTASGSDTVTSGNYIWTDTVASGGTFVNLAGHTEWTHAMIGGVDSAVTGSADLISGAGVSAAAVFDGDFRIKSSRTDLVNKGDNSLYPLNAASLVTQCYGDAPLTPGGWGYKFKGGGTASQEADMSEVLNTYLYTWLGGVYTKVTDITMYNTDAAAISLGNDNGGSKGDQRSPEPDNPARPRKNGSIDIGAYEN
jgi:hypothetical protein